MAVNFIAIVMLIALSVLFILLCGMLNKKLGDSMAKITELNDALVGANVAIDNLILRVDALKQNQGVPEVELDPILQGIKDTTARTEAIATTP